MTKPLDDARPKYEMPALVRRLKPIKANYTDLGNGRRLVGLFGADIRFCPEHKRWLVWDGSRWVWDEVGEINRYAKLVIRVMYGRASEEQDEDTSTRISGWAFMSESAYRIQKMIELAQTEHGIPILASELDNDPNLLGVQIGVIDLRTGQLLAPRREQYITKQCPVVFDPDADCPQWQRFIDRITGGDKDLARYLQCVAGYFLTGSTREQCLFILHGPGANGKSVFLRVIQKLMGTYARSTPPATLMVRRNPDSPSPDLARLHGVRLALAFEPREGAMLAEEIVKQITGQDKITCRKLYGDIFEYVPQFKVVLTTNHLPTIRGNDHAIWRRIRLIPFTVIIPPEEQDRDLIEKLMGELPGILNWAVEGLRAYQDEGLKPPTCVVAATQEYRSDMDIIGDWIDECCIVDPDARVPMRDAYASYRDWCKASGHYPFAKKRFGQRLRDRGIGEARTSRERFYVGLALKRQEPGDVLEQTVHGAFGTG